MKRLLQPNHTPISGYYFVDPDTGFQFNRRYKNFTELENHVQTYRAQNNLPKLDRFRQTWEAFVCENDKRMEPHCCDVSAHVKRTYEQYFKGAVAYFKAKIYGDDAFATQEQAEARAEKCLNCNQNVRNIGHNHAQLYSDKMIKAHVGNKTTKFSKELFTCSICSCILATKVHFSDKIVAKSLTSSDISKLKMLPKNVKTARPIKCWQLETLDTDG